MPNIQIFLSLQSLSGAKTFLTIRIQIHITAFYQRSGPDSDRTRMIMLCNGKMFHYIFLLKKFFKNVLTVLGR